MKHLVRGEIVGFPENDEAYLVELEGDDSGEPSEIWMGAIVEADGFDDGVDEHGYPVGTVVYVDLMLEPIYHLPHDVPSESDPN